MAHALAEEVVRRTASRLTNSPLADGWVELAGTTLEAVSAPAADREADSLIAAVVAVQTPCYTGADIWGCCISMNQYLNVCFAIV